MLYKDYGEDMKKIVLVGNPNSGKTTLFNCLTKTTAHVGNWPGVTVEKKEGVYKGKNEVVNVIDLPGIYSLSPYSLEEIVTRKCIIEDNIDCIINIIDATNFERNLYLTTQLMELDIPIVIALNMMDVLKKNDEYIEVKKLEEKLNIPIVEISALRLSNVDKLMDIAIKHCNKKRNAKTILNNLSFHNKINSIYTDLNKRNIKQPLFNAIKILENDSLALKENNVKPSILNDNKDYEAIIANYRYQYISENYSILKHKNEEKINKTNKIDKIFLNKWLSIPLFLVIIFLIFHLTFSKNLFFLKNLINDVNNPFENTFFDNVFLTSDGINSLGVILLNLFNNVIEIINKFITNLLVDSPSWVSSLLINGVLKGVFSVLSFLPQILCLFMFFSILEDSGYMARIAFILDKPFRKIGLSGKAFLPLIMGWGCSVPAIMNTRILADEKEKITTVRIIPFMVCGAKIPIITTISAFIFQISNIKNVDIITYFFYLFGIMLAIICAYIMRKTMLKSKESTFIMEMPPYRLPQLKSLFIHLWDKAKHFITKVFTTILVSTIIIWLISHFSIEFRYLNDNEIDQSLLSLLGKIIQPLFTPLGFGKQLTNWGWIFSVAIITGLVAKENVIATLVALSACISINNVSEIGTIINATNISVGGLISFVIFNLTTIPCFATLAATKAELSKKQYIFSILFWLITSYFVSSMIYLIIEFRFSLLLIEIIFFIISFSIALLKYKEKRKWNQLKSS